MVQKRFSKFSAHPILLALLVLVVLAGGWFAVDKLVLSSGTSLPKGVTPVATPADNESNNQRKSSSSPATTLNGNPTKPSSSSNPALSLTITRAGVVDKTLQVGTLVNGTTTGTCTLQVSQGGQATITRTNQVSRQTNSYVCPVFSIPIDQFPNQDKWNVSVTLVTDSGSTTATWVNNPVDLSGSNL